jgi:hypothetical protein
MDEVANSLTHALRLLRCIEPLMAQSELSAMPASLSAFGAKRTCRHLGWRIARAPLTLTGHERPTFAAMHGLTCYT